jgi:RimJ/RimL family protein N-acetyltransferase
MRPPETIQTERLTLCKPLMDDARAVFETWAQDPEVTRTMTWRPHEDIDVTRSVLRRMIDAWERGTRFPYVIIEKSSNKAAGMIEIRPEGHMAEIGYVLARVHWGKGYMTEAATALRDWAFNQPEIFRVYATTSVDNIGSRRVMEKIGMTREGLMRRYIIHPNVSSEPVDSYLYAIVR